MVLGEGVGVHQCKLQGWLCKVPEKWRWMLGFYRDIYCHQWHLGSPWLLGQDNARHHSACETTEWFFRKATDHNTLLHAHSFHPPWLIDNIPFGQIQRLRRICDSDQDFPNQSMDIQLHIHIQRLSNTNSHSSS